MSQFHPLEQSVLRLIDKHNLREANFTLLVSGGEDSMVLLEVFSRLRPLLSKPLRVLCVHHGESLNGTSSAKKSNKLQERFRLKALKLVQKRTVDYGIEFLTNYSAFDLQPLSDSEADLREFRALVVKALTGDDIHQIIVTGHHLNDQIETQMHRLIRGTGLKGIKAMREFNNKVFRPLLTTPRKELESYAKLRKVIFAEDPSNKKSKYFRNWLRNDWLPALEKRSPGSLKSLAKSLKILSEIKELSSATANESSLELNSQSNILANETSITSATPTHFEIETAQFLLLKITEQKLKIFQWMSQLAALSSSAGSQLQPISSNKVDEVQRQIQRVVLDKRQSEHTFKAGGVTWVVSPRFISCSSDKSPDQLDESKGFVFTP